MSHTKGPWEAFATMSGDMAVVDVEMVAIAHTYKSARISEAEMVANASLIAAAPELLEELGRLLQCVEVYGLKFMHGIPCEEYVKSARAVIAKATAHRSA